MLQFLHLKLIELTSDYGLEDYTQIKQHFLSFIPFLEEFGTPELHVWSIYQMSKVCFWWDNHSEAISWLEKAIQASREMQDEHITYLVTIEKIWVQVQGDLSDKTTFGQLKEMYAYFEPHYAKSHAFTWLAGRLGC